MSYPELSINYFCTKFPSKIIPFLVKSYLKITHDKENEGTFCLTNLIRCTVPRVTIE
jgi:hypothetical protein